MLNKRLMFSCFVLSTTFLSALFVNKVIANTLPIPPPQTAKATPLNSALQAELLAMQQVIVKLQQEKIAYPHGKLPVELIDKIAKVNSKNGLRLLNITKHQGWPTIALVGAKARDAALIIVQQADQSVQTLLLPTLRNEFEQDQLSGQKLASFIDIMLIKSGKKQRYATQLAIVNGQIVFNDIADKSKLDLRRQEMNMLPMAQYKRLLKRMYQLD